jgi:hypothetical protein
VLLLLVVANCCVPCARAMKIAACGGGQQRKNVVVESFITRVHAMYRNPERGRSVLLGKDDTWEKTDGTRCVHQCGRSVCVKLKSRSGKEVFSGACGGASPTQSLGALNEFDVTSFSIISCDLLSSHARGKGVGGGSCFLAKVERARTKI